MKSDIITKVQTTYTPDGHGGYTEETIELGSFDVKLGVSNNVQEATAYGVSVEQILKVIADVPLLEDDSEVHIIIGPSGPPGPASEGASTWNQVLEKPFNSIDNDTLIVENNILKVNTTVEATQDNTRPITSGGVYTIVGNIETILSSI